MIPSYSEFSINQMIALVLNFRSLQEKNIIVTKITDSPEGTLIENS